MSYTRPHADRLGTSGATDKVLTWTSSGVAEYRTPSGGGGVTIKHLDASDPEAATILRVAHFTVNAANDVTIFPQITGEGAGTVTFDAAQTSIASPDFEAAIYLPDSTGLLEIDCSSGILMQVGANLVGVIIEQRTSTAVRIKDSGAGSYDVELTDTSPKVWKTTDGTLSTNLANLHWLKNGTADPSAGAGVASAIGSLYQRNSGGVGTLWLKTGAADTAWTLAPDLDAHINDATDAHDATAISFTPTGSIAATDVQSAIAEVAAEAGSSSGHWEVIMVPGVTSPPEPLQTIAGDDWVYGFVP